MRWTTLDTGLIRGRWWGAVAQTRRRRLLPLPHLALLLLAIGLDD
ncbi:hypothetical protein [Microbispora sp. H10836]|nr:hypothetical protein [Microbispora sp. H10836]